MTDRVRCRRDLKQRPGEIARTGHIAEYPNDVQLVARNRRPAKRNGTHIAENSHQTLGTFDGGPLIDATHRHAGDNTVVNRYKGHRRKFWKSAGQLPVSRLLPLRLSHFERKPQLCSDNADQYAALRIAASDAMVFADESDDRLTLSSRTQIYNISIFSPFFPRIRLFQFRQGFMKQCLSFERHFLPGPFQRSL
jgi:hypothetical protein